MAASLDCMYLTNDCLQIIHGLTIRDGLMNNSLLDTSLSDHTGPRDRTMSIGSLASQRSHTSSFTSQSNSMNRKVDVTGSFT
jgi:hypothetical protein